MQRLLLTTVLSVALFSTAAYAQFSGGSAPGTTSDADITNPALPAIDGEPISPTPRLGGDPIRRAANGACLEPGHPAYLNTPPQQTYRTLRACIADGGTRNIREDTMMPDGSQRPAQPAVPRTQPQPETLEPSPPTMTPSAPGQRPWNRQDVQPQTPGPQGGLINQGILPVPTEDSVAPTTPADTLAIPTILDENGNPLAAEDITEERLLALQAQGLIPADFNVAEAISAMESANMLPRRASGPREIELPARPSFSEKPSLFRPAEAYIGRDASNFLP